MNRRMVQGAFGLVIAIACIGAGANGTAEVQPSAPVRGVTAGTTDADADVIAKALAAYEAKNYRESMRLFLPLAEKGSAQAQYYVGRMYEKGQGVSKDEVQMKQWYQRSAESGYAPSQYRVAVGHATGFGGLRRSDQEAVMWLQRSAEGGYARAQKALGQAYADGRFGLPQDSVKAQYWTKKSQEKR